MALGRPRAIVGHTYSPGVRHPPEDFFLIADDLSACAVADGVSRDRYQASDFAHGSGAAAAAELFSRSVVESLARDEARDPRAALRTAFAAANAAIRALNAAAFGEEPTDYLERDLYGCVGAALVVRAGALHYGYLGDCRVALCAPPFDKVFETPDDLSPTRRYLLCRQFPTPEARKKLARSGLRNNPSAEDELGRKVGYGVLTGEEAAMAFFRSGSLSAGPGWHALLYSDGFAPLLASDPFVWAFGERAMAGDRGGLGEWLANCYQVKRPFGVEVEDDATVVLLAL